MAYIPILCNEQEVNMSIYIKIKIMWYMVSVTGYYKIDFINSYKHMKVICMHLFLDMKANSYIKDRSNIFEKKDNAKFPCAWKSIAKHHPFSGNGYLKIMEY